MGRPTMHTEFANVGDFRDGPFLYAFELSNGVIKVGRANNGRHRLVRHKADATARGLRMVRFDIVSTQSDSDLTERELLARIARLGEIHSGNEWFSGVSWGAVKTLLHQFAPREIVEFGRREIPGYVEWAHRKSSRWGKGGAWEYISSGCKPRAAANHPFLNGRKVA